MLFIEFWTKKHQKNNLQNPIFLGAIIGFFLLTRGIIVIPFIVFFLKDFIKIETKGKIKFIVSIIITSILICIPTLLSVDSWETFINYNPLILQTDKTPKFAYLFLLIPFLIPYLTKSKKDYYFYISIIIFVIPCTSLLAAIINAGWDIAIFNHLFDLTYLSMCLPSLLIWIKINNENQLIDSQFLAPKNLI
jgi:uncharacterized membrane protein